ncbi:TPA: MurR/RpiR family transcriptional regulator [Streptococcus suis]|nr:MurR/RpiR family transcriptional regulator [Streptococcus suis]HEP1825334.1 MurR/RpiR family transcriptional regulator [Streptococcus suis]HEP1842275.1 MurR/RpiR family transcriptional regulator [Streptococcus suis]
MAINKHLTETEKHTWTHLNNKFKEISTLSISEASELLNVSTATITRTLQKKGYTGFSDFKHDVKDRKQDSLTILKDKKITDEIKVSVLKSYQEVTKTLNELDLETLEMAISKLQIAKKITIFARGFSELLATEMQTKFLLLGYYTELHTDPNIIRTVSARLDTNDCVVFVSLNGETIELQDAAKICQKNDTTTILLSANPSGSLSNYTQIKLFGFKTELTYFLDVEVHSRLPLYIIGRLLLDTLAANQK